MCETERKRKEFEEFVLLNFDAGKVARLVVEGYPKAAEILQSLAQHRFMPEMIQFVDLPESVPPLDYFI